jgi:hypothetical protein
LGTVTSDRSSPRGPQADLLDAAADVAELALVADPDRLVGEDH